MAQLVKNPPAMWDTRVQSLGWEDPLEEEMAPHSRILACRIPWTEDPGRLTGDMEALCPLPYTCSMHLFHPAVPELCPFIINQ